MKREMIDEKDLGKVVGGSIVFNGDMTTCGFDCNNQYAVLDCDAALNYMMANIMSMDEHDILNNCVQMGYITPM